MATPPRISPPGSIQFITRRTIDGQFLFRPDPNINQNYLYLLGLSQLRYQLEIHLTCLMSNHPHILATDVIGDQIQSFNTYFFGLLARSTNCYLGRQGYAFDNDKPNCVIVAPRAEDIIDRAAYILLNPVVAGLVETAKKWPGVRILPHEMGRLEIEIQRPDFFYDEHGDMPESVTLRITIPKVWDAEPEELRQRISEEMHRREREVQRRMRDEGRKFVGAKAVKRRSVNSRPRKERERERFGLIPHVACKDGTLRERMLEWRKRRQQRYEELRQLLLDGVKDLVFPEGTWALHFRGGQDRDPWGECIWRRLAAEP